jgi:recombination protein RecA
VTQPLSIRDVYRARRFLDESNQRQRGLALGDLRGRLSEFCALRGHPNVTAAVELIAQAHRAGEPAAWIGPTESFFYPPDVANHTLDWSALAVVRLNRPQRQARAADRLLRSGAFGLVVVDLCHRRRPDITSGLLGRLLHLAEEQDSAVLFLTATDPEGPSISSLISIRARADWTDVDPFRLRSSLTTVKDKRRGPGHSTYEAYHGPLGLR